MRTGASGFSQLRGETFPPTAEVGNAPQFLLSAHRRVRLCSEDGLGGWGLVSPVLGLTALRPQSGLRRGSARPAGPGNREEKNTYHRRF